MATLTVRDFDDELKARLRVRAAENGRSMEAEVRVILAESLADDRNVSDPPEYGLGTWIHEQFGDVGGLDLDLPKRTELPRYVDFGS